MKVIVTKVIALGSLCALFAGIGNGAVAQGYAHRYGEEHGHTPPMVRHERQRLQRLHSVYAREINHGNRAAAERACERIVIMRIKPTRAVGYQPKGCAPVAGAQPLG